MDKENANPIVEVGSKRDASIFGAVPSTDDDAAAAAVAGASEAAAAGGSQIPAGWDPYDPVPYVPPPNPYDTSLEDPWNEMSGSDVGSDEEEEDVKTRQVLRRLQVGQYISYFAKEVYRCPFCTRRLGATDFNCLVTHAENISNTFPNVGTTVNVHSFRAKHRALGMHLRSLQRVEISAGRMPPLKPKAPKGSKSNKWRQSQMGTRSHGIRWKGFSPEGALDGVDLSTPSEERTRSLRQEINFMVAHSLHRHSESLVNTLERVALRVIQEIMSHQYSPSGPALGTHQGEALLHSRPPLPFALAAPEAPNSSAFVVYKIGGDPSDYQFLQDAPKEIPHGYACAYVPDCSTWAPSNQVAIAGTSGATGGTSEADPEKQTWLAKYATPTKLPSPAPAVGSEPEKQAWLVKYATPTNLQGSAPAAITADQICTILKDQFGMMPKRKAIGYTKPYPNEYELIPLPPKYRLPDFTKFSGSDGSSSIEHVSRYLAQLGMISASDELRVRYFSQSLTGSAFGWYTSLPPNSIQTWKQLEERFHEQYHSEASEAGIADLAQVRQKRGETVSEYIQRFRTVRNRCYSVHVSEKEAVELAVVGLSSSIKEVASQADYPSLAHMVQKLSAYEQRHPDIYQDKFKRVVTMVDAGEDEGPTGEREVAVAEWTRAAGPVTCKWVKPPGPPRGFDFDVTKTEQIFDLLLAEKHIKVPEGHKFPTVQELNGKPYCKWHNTFTHTTNDCRVWRQQIQVAIENGRLIFNQYAMKVDTHPFPAVNMVEFTHLGGCQPDFSANISMVELGHRSEKDGDEDSCSQSKDTEGAAPCDRLRQDGKRYVTEGEVKNIRYQRPLSDHLLNKYVSRYDQRRRYDNNDERGRMTINDGRHRRHNHDEERQERHGREQDDTDRHWHCPFFRHCWDSGMSRLPTIGNCPECNRKKKETANVSVFERLGPLPPQNRRAETPPLEDLEDSEDEGEYEEDRCHRPRWCPDGLSHTQKRRVQRLRGLEEAERMYLHTLRKARPDLAAKVQRTLDEEGLPQRKEWRPKQKRADDDTSAGTNMVFIRPAECSAPRLHSAPDMDNSKRTNVLSRCKGIDFRIEKQPMHGHRLKKINVTIRGPMKHEGSLNGVIPLFKSSLDVQKGADSTSRALREDWRNSGGSSP
ncbi:hypothetical protein QYE76_051649 [Lolium multiflorum]|uniref:Retrotransposon gag domain-containing protein n=1 Tax=Lolium multiflorum TaxID=4521 RepID=A0AAD8WKR6_LOLMU|nr:hypothetical protein QYE76_051649 [Lolium multiflorum]